MNRLKRSTIRGGAAPRSQAGCKMGALLCWCRGPPIGGGVSPQSPPFRPSDRGGATKSTRAGQRMDGSTLLQPAAPSLHPGCIGGGSCRALGGGGYAKGPAAVQPKTRQGPHCAPAGTCFFFNLASLASKRKVSRLSRTRGQCRRHQSPAAAVQMRLASTGQGAVSALGSGRACPTVVIAFCPSCQCTARSQSDS